MKNSFWTNKICLVTGANGFLAGWLIKLLLKQGAKVVGIVRDHNSQCNLYLSGIHNYIDIVRGSICDYYTVERAINEYEVNVVFHIAAQAIVRVADRSPIQTFQTNIIGTANLLEAVLKLGSVERVIIASSDKVYGSQRLPYRENSQFLCSFPYDCSKACTEMISRAFFETYFKKNQKTLIGITRCANLYGGGDFNFSRIIPGQLIRVLKNEPLKFNLCKRQFLYVLDAVQAYLKLAENLDRQSVNGEAFNFGEDTGISMRSLIQDYIVPICAKSVKNIRNEQLFYTKDGEIISQEDHNFKKLECLNYPPREIQEQFMDCKKALQILDWRPVYNLQSGIVDTWKWYQNWYRQKNMMLINEELIERFFEKKRQMESSVSTSSMASRSKLQDMEKEQDNEILALQEV